MISKIQKSKKSKTSKHSKKSKTSKHSKKSINKHCSYYKTDINGKINKKLYNSCKINKYCRKYKCKDIDFKILLAKQKNIGLNYNKIIFDKINEKCNKNIINEDDDEKILNRKNKNCVSNTIKNIYKDNNMTELYNKSKECDKIICAK